MTEPLEKGWYLEELAAYQHHIDPDLSQKTLAGARKKNPAVLKPKISPPGKKLVGPAAQGKQAAEYLDGEYTDARNLELKVMSSFDNIVWGVEHAADLSEEQFWLLGFHLGFGSSRPEKEERDGGPDNLWVLSARQYAVIELKTDISRNNPVIIKSEAEQLTHSMTWFSQRYPEASTPIPVLVHPSAELDTQAHVPPGTRVITETGLRLLRQDVEAFVKHLTLAKTWSNPSAVTSALKQHNLTAENVLQQHSESIRQ